MCELVHQKQTVLAENVRSVVREIAYHVQGPGFHPSTTTERNKKRKHSDSDGSIYFVSSKQELEAGGFRVRTQPFQHSELYLSDDSGLVVRGK